MNAWLIAGLAFGGWCVLAVALSLLLGLAIRSNIRTPNRTTAGRPAPAWARQKTRRRP